MTTKAVEANAMKYMGVRKSVSEKTYIIQEINGIKVGFFKYLATFATKKAKSNQIALFFILYIV